NELDDPNKLHDSVGPARARVATSCCTAGSPCWVVSAGRTIQLQFSRPCRESGRCTPGVFTTIWGSKRLKNSSWQRTMADSNNTLASAQSVWLAFAIRSPSDWHVSRDSECKYQIGRASCRESGKIKHDAVSRIGKRM